MEPNEDTTSSCQMSPAYIDTRIGRLLTDVDAALKSLWHGIWFPREKRIKFTERWHNAVDISTPMGGDVPVVDKEARNQLLAEFLNAGLHCNNLSIEGKSKKFSDNYGYYETVRCVFIILMTNK